MKKLIFILLLFVASFSSYSHNGEKNVEFYESGIVKSKVIPHENFSEVIKYYESGAVEETELFDSNNQKTGRWIRYSENGQIMGEANFKNGKKDGDWKIYNMDGKLIVYILYKSGKKEVACMLNGNKEMAIR